MRIILTTKGAPGSGKSTFLERMGLTPYTLSADTLRLQMRAPDLLMDGKVSTVMDKDNEVWSLLYQLVDTRMQRGELIVIDACFSKESDYCDLKKLAEQYRYRIYSIDLTGVPVDVALAQNLQRPEHKHVPEPAIRRMYERFKSQNTPGYVKRIPATKEAIDDLLSAKLFDFNQYKKVNIFGDIHGCYTALSEYFKGDMTIKDDEFYLFTGDLYDRGLENAKVVRFMQTIVNRENVLVLASNHGRWFQYWAFGRDDLTEKNYQFKLTVKDFEAEGFTRSEARSLIRREGQYAYFTFAGKRYFVNHGGLPKFVERIGIVSLNQLEKGVGKYPDVDAVADSWNANTPDDFYQVHGHRSTGEDMPALNGRVFRLEAKVDEGGFLRVLELTPEDTDVVEVRNTVYDKTRVRHDELTSGEVKTKRSDIGNIGDLIATMRDKKDILEKRMGDISSFSFKRRVFNEASWDDMNIMARGFFVKTSGVTEPYVVCRAWEKSFNFSERHETKEDALRKNLVFPVWVFHKYNGFFGCVGLDRETNDFVFTSKSTIDGEFAILFRTIFEKSFPVDKGDELKKWMRDNNTCMVFEVMSPKSDPHIIEYQSDEIVLLDAFYCEMETKKVSYRELRDVSARFSFKCKELSFVANTYEEMFAFFEESRDNEIEGYMAEDCNGFMFKYKLPFYKKWKMLRGLTEAFLNGRNIHVGSIVNLDENQFFSFVKKTYGHLSKEDKQKISKKGIIYLRNEFLKTV